MPTSSPLLLEKLYPDAPLAYGISNRFLFPQLDPHRYLELLFQTSAAIIQWREKDLPPQEGRELIRRGVKLARSRGKLFIVNSQWESALDEDAHGVHLPSSLPLEPVSSERARRNRSEFLIGKSTHSLDEAEAAEREGADYVFFGPVFEPISKSSTLVPRGLSAFKEICQALYIPVFPLGGMAPQTIPAVLQTGAIGYAGISWMGREVQDLLSAQ